MRELRADIAAKPIPGIFDSCIQHHKRAQVTSPTNWCFTGSRNVSPASPAPHVPTRIHICMCIHMYIHVHIYVYTCTYVCVCMNVYMHLYLYVYAYVYIYVYTYILIHMAIMAVDITIADPRRFKSLYVYWFGKAFLGR